MTATPVFMDDVYVCLFLSVFINAMSKVRNLQPKRRFFQPYNMI